MTRSQSIRITGAAAGIGAEQVAAACGVQRNQVLLMDR